MPEVIKKALTKLTKAQLHILVTQNSGLAAPTKTTKGALIDLVWSLYVTQYGSEAAAEAAAPGLAEHIEGLAKGTKQ